MRNRKTNYLLMVPLIGGLVGLMAFFGWNSTRNQPAQRPTAQTQKAPVQKPAPAAAHLKPVTYQGQEGVSALAILKETHDVVTKKYEGLGELVTTIDGATPDSKHFWAFYVNDQKAEVGADTYITKSTDAISWKLEEITT